MQFEEMQVVWNSQNDEKLFALNDAELHKSIKRKGRSIHRWLEFFEWAMVASNFIVASIFIGDAIQEGGRPYQFVLSAVYFTYLVYALIRRHRRRNEEVSFEPTILGELNKALWQIDYLIKQGRSIMWWYVVPLTVVISLSLFFTSKPWWAVLFLLLLIPISYFGPRWEINKWYLPKKQELKALREKLIAPEPEI